MSDIDHLEEIAEASAFGSHGISPRHNVSHRHPTEHCGGGHLWTEETIRWYRDRGRRRRLCRICDKERRLNRKLMQCSGIAPSIAPGMLQAGAE